MNQIENSAGVICVSLAIIPLQKVMNPSVPTCLIVIFLQKEPVHDTPIRLADDLAHQIIDYSLNETETHVIWKGDNQ